MTMNNRLWKKLLRPRYLDAFIAANVGVQIATQLHALRTSRGKSQDKLAAEMGMNQATISLMEKPDYGKYNIGTLIRFAQHYKVALDVRFVSIMDHVKRILDQTPESMAPPPFGEPSTAAAQELETPVQKTEVPQEPALLQKLKVIPTKPFSKDQENIEIKVLMERMGLEFAERGA